MSEKPPVFKVVEGGIEKLERSVTTAEKTRPEFFSEMVQSEQIDVWRTQIMNEGWSEERLLVHLEDPYRWSSPENAACTQAVIDVVKGRIVPPITSE